MAMPTVMMTSASSFCTSSMVQHTPLRGFWPVRPMYALGDLPRFLRDLQDQRLLGHVGEEAGAQPVEAIPHGGLSPGNGAPG